MLHFFVSILLLVIHATSFAASFECGRAAQCIEKTICNHPGLNRADEYMGEAYENLKKTLVQPQVAELQVEQRDWLERRDSECACGDVGCLLKLYQERTEILKFRISYQYDMSSTAKISGRYFMNEEHKQMVMVIRPLSEQRVSIQIDGADVPLISWTCSFSEVGSLQGNVIIVNHESEDTPITFAFSEQEVEVKGEELDDFCGLGGHIGGKYIKSK